MKGYKVRLTLNDDEVLEVIKAISKTNYQLCTKIQTQFNKDTQRDITKKQDAIKTATRSRENTAKAKINNAINILRLEAKEITAYAIAQESKCSYNTVRKYLQGLTDGR